MRISALLLVVALLCGATFGFTSLAVAEQTDAPSSLSYVGSIESGTLTVTAAPGARFVVRSKNDDGTWTWLGCSVVGEGGTQTVAVFATAAYPVYMVNVYTTPMATLTISPDKDGWLWD